MQSKEAILPVETSATPIRYSRMVSQSPVFYGWIIMATAMFGMIMTSPGQTYSVSIFIEYFIAELGISRTLVSTLYSFGTLGGSFALPLVGRQIDKRGTQLMIVIISVLFGVACIYMGFVQNAIMLGLGFVAIRMLGQGSLSLVCGNVVNQWWVRRRGMAMGITGLVTSLLGLGGFPSLINWLIPMFGWRTTYMILGLGLIAILAPLGGLLLRNKPEEYGVQPDGGVLLVQTNKDTVLPLSEENWTLSEARRTPAFWIIIASIGSIGALSTGLFFHMIDIFKENGLSDTVAASVFVPISVTMALVNLGGGFLVDRIPVRFIMSAALIGQTVVLIMAQSLQTVVLAFAYGIILGIMLGLMRTGSSVVWANYFGRQHLGTITGTASTIMIAASAFGPMPFGAGRDWLGSYNLVLSIGAILPFILAIVVLYMKQPKRAEII